MTEEHKKELKRRLTECNGKNLNQGSTKYLTGYTTSGNLSNGQYLDLFKDKVGSDVFLTNVGRDDYYKFDTTDSRLGQKLKLEKRDVDNLLSKRVNYGLLYLQEYQIDSLGFYRSTILKNILVKGGLYEDIKLEGCDLLGFSVFNVERLNTLSIDSCEFASDIMIESNNTDITISNVSGTKLKIFIKGSNNKIKIREDVIFSEGITIVGSDHSLSPTIEFLSFENCDVSSNVKIEQLHVTSMKVSKSDFRNQFLLFQTIIRKLCISKSSFNYSERSRFVFCNVISSFNLNAVDFGNMSFIDCNFDELKQLSFEGVNLSNCSSVGTSWECGLNSIHEKHKYDYYKQIYKIHDEEKDVQKSLEYKALYLEEVRKRVDSIGDKLSLWLASYSSEHGTNWWKPVFMLLLFACVNFLLINGINYFQQTPNSFIVFTVPDVLVFMNPTHLFSHYSFKADDYFYIWDTIMRVVNGYLIFQVIKSFRKFLK